MKTTITADVPDNKSLAEVLASTRHMLMHEAIPVGFKVTITRTNRTVSMSIELTKTEDGIAEKFSSTLVNLTSN